ncbi:glycosyl hydrolase family 18 protein [Paenibacillus lacisoli]|nr:glycosyl hydrolase family 18 protein [Paenibacillus sp. JX-17]
MSFKRLLGIIIILCGAGWLTYQLTEHAFHEEPEWRKLNKPIFVDGQVMDAEASGSGENLKLPLRVLQEAVDPGIRYEEDKQTIIMASPDQLLKMNVDSSKSSLNNKAYALKTPPSKEGDVVYVPIQPLKEVYGITVREDETTGAVLLLRAGEKVTYAYIAKKSDPKDTIALHKEPSSVSAIYAEAVQGERVRIWKDEGSWYEVQLDNGYTGYVKHGQLSGFKDRRVEDKVFLDTPAQQKWAQKPVNLTWEAVYDRKPDVNQIGRLPGVNVISPTWFSIVNGEGQVESKVDPAYVNWAHRQGIEIWALLSNSFEPELTSKALASYESRMSIISQIIAYTTRYQIDGINIDFESVKTEDGDEVTQFVRELRPYARQHGLILSIDVTPKSNSELWSKFLDRKTLGGLVDYMMVMAYDEHWASSPEAGSVSSLPWAEKTMRRILEEDKVPASKLVLGIPLYTRVWTEAANTDGTTKVSSKAIGMESAQNILQDQKLKPQFLKDIGQNYVEYQAKEGLRRIWLEDEESLNRRVELAESLKLAGIATWTRSLASSDAWNVLKTFQKQN